MMLKFNECLEYSPIAYLNTILRYNMFCIVDQIRLVVVRVYAIICYDRLDYLKKINGWSKAGNTFIRLLCNSIHAFKILWYR